MDPWEAVQLTRRLSQGQPELIRNTHLQAHNSPEPLGLLQIYRILDADLRQDCCLRTDTATLTPDCKVKVLALSGANSSAKGLLPADV